VVTNFLQVDSYHGINIEGSDNLSFGYGKRETKGWVSVLLGFTSFFEVIVRTNKIPKLEGLGTCLPDILIRKKEVRA